MFTPDFLKNQTVLFVEDEELAREKLAKLLSKLFKEVILASNGLEGLEKYEKSKKQLTPECQTQSEIEKTYGQ